MIVRKQCNMCGRTFDIVVPAHGWYLWRQGMLIQKAMPTVAPADREILISGTCGECFDNLFGKGKDA